MHRKQWGHVLVSDGGVIRVEGCSQRSINARAPSLAASLSLLAVAERQHHYINMWTEHTEPLLNLTLQLQSENVETAQRRFYRDQGSNVCS